MLNFLIYIFLVIAVVWLIAVFKVFILDDDSITIDNLDITSRSNSFSEIKENVPYEIKQIISLPKRNADKSLYIIHRDQDYVRNIASKPASDFKVPITAEWLYIRSSKDYQIESRDFVTQSQMLLPHHAENIRSTLQSTTVPKAVLDYSSNKTPSHKLQWPPVQPDGSIAPDEGEDTMPLIGLKVPRFWEAPPGTTDAELNVMGSKVNGEETIFLMIASYRDFQCRETITSAFSRADHPERLFVGAVDQTVPGDVGCLDLEVPCEQDPSQPICRHRSQISVYHMDAKYATGPVTARHVGDRMYRGESFVMQMDAHCQFVRHWDSKIISQWRATNNHMAVLRLFLLFYYFLCFNCFC